MRELLSADEIAERLGVHVSTVRGWIRDGSIPAIRVGPRLLRVRWRDLVEDPKRPSIRQPTSPCSVDPDGGAVARPTCEDRRTQDEEASHAS